MINCKGCMTAAEIKLYLREWDGGCDGGEVTANGHVKNATLDGETKNGLAFYASPWNLRWESRTP